MYGLAVDWPIEWAELERFYCEAERRIGVSGEPSPLAEDARSEPYPMPPMPLSWNLRQLKAWAEKSGIPFWATPQAKNTRAVRRPQRVQALQHLRDLSDRRALLAGLHVQAAARREGDRAARSDARAPARAGRRRRQDAAHRRGAGRASRPPERSGRVPRADVRASPSGYCWSPHLLLLSASSRFPNGLANSSGLVGRYMNGHAFIDAQIELDAEIYPGMNEQHSLISRQFFRCATDKPFVRHDLRIWESARGREPRLRDDDGRVLLGDALLADWRARTKRGTARVRAYYDVHPVARQHADARSGGEEPLRRPAAEDRAPARRGDRGAAARRRKRTSAASSRGWRASTTARCCRRARATISIIPPAAAAWATDPATSVCDSYGRTHDHENLFVVGSPTLPTGGCTNGTLTFAALTLRSANEVASALGPDVDARRHRMIADA